MKLTVYRRVNEEKDVPLDSKTPILLKFVFTDREGIGYPEWYRCFLDPSRYAMGFQFITNEDAQQILSKGAFRRE